MTHTRILVGGDTHIPYHDPKAIECFLRLARHMKPASVHLIGDHVDFYPLSSHQKDPDKRQGLQEELDMTAQFIAAVRQAVGPKCPIIYHEGNHEDRLRRYLNREAGELSGLRSLTLQSLLGFAEQNIIFRPANQPYSIHRQLLITHGTLCRAHSAYTAKSMVERFGMSVIHGHTHRMGMHYKTVWDTTMFGVENGCLCRLDANPSNAYAKGMPNWQQGFSIIHVWKTAKGKPVVEVEQVQITNGQHRPIQSG